MYVVIGISKILEDFFFKKKEYEIMCKLKMGFDGLYGLFFADS